jgi:hypothetical protein
MMIGMPVAQQKSSRSAIATIMVLVMMFQFVWMVTTLTGCANKELLPLSAHANVYELMPESTSTSTSKSTSVDHKASKATATDEPYDGPQKVYQPWNYSAHPFPCFPGEDKWKTPAVVRSPSRQGFLFVRNMKTGSSTLGGITIRIARSMARKFPQIDTDLCKVRFDHTPARLLEYGKRDHSKSYLFSFVRDPTKRAVSEFFHFGVSRFKREPTAQNFKDYLLSKWFLNNYFLWDMTFRNFNGTAATWEDKKRTVDEIMADYNFIGITERMDESLVVMKILLNLEFNDILYLSAKGNGGFDDGAYKGICHFIVPSYVPPAMKEFFAGPVWNNFIDGDTLLYKAAERSLDLTIDAIGKDEVKRHVVEYRRLRELAKEKCLPTTIQPCTEDGAFHRNTHNCLFWDSGCGYECLDDFRDMEPQGFTNPQHKAPPGQGLLFEGESAAAAAAEPVQLEDARPDESKI